LLAGNEKVSEREYFPTSFPKEEKKKEKKKAEQSILVHHSMGLLAWETWGRSPHISLPHCPERLSVTPNPAAHMSRSIWKNALANFPFTPQLLQHLWRREDALCSQSCSFGMQRVQS
jgi:hypothetical protein